MRLAFVFLLPLCACTGAPSGGDTAVEDCTTYSAPEAACEQTGGVCTEWIANMSADDIEAMNETCEFGGGTVVDACDHTYTGGGCTTRGEHGCPTVWNYTDEVTAEEGQATCEDLLDGIWRAPE